MKHLLLEWAPIVTAITVVIISACSLYWTRKAFVVSHRPYVWAVTHAYLDNNNRVVVDVNTLRKLCSNAPAVIVKQEYSYVVVKNDNSVHTVYKNPKGEGSSIMYPADPKISQETYTILPNELTLLISNPEINKVLRKVRIVYKGLSIKKTYFFEGEWEYDRQGNVWKPIKSVGD